MTKFLKQTAKFIGSRIFFRLTLVWFAIQSVWIAFSGLYPMAFDERYHFEVIKIYSERLHPFWSSMPPGEAPYGALSRDPSYLYHYLMGFPYRILERITNDEFSQVVTLRLTSVLFFIGGLIVFRKVLTNTGISDKLSNMVMAMVVATPIVSLLAGQINYDNLFFLVFALTVLSLQNFTAAVKSNSLKSTHILQLAIICMVGSLIKYAFLPVLASVIAVMVYVFLRQRSNVGLLTYLRTGLSGIVKDFRGRSVILKLWLLIPFFVLFGLSMERYGVNLQRYGTPAPECDKVLSVDQCFANPPWRRNYITRWSKENGKLDELKDTNFVKFALKSWPEKTTYHLFYAIDGERTRFLIRDPIMLTRNVSLIVGIVGGVLYIIHRRRIHGKYQMNQLLFVSLVYILSLLLQNYSDFVYLGYPFGIQGRYLIPALPIIYTAVGIGISMAIGNKRMAKSAVALVSIVYILTQGGGAATYIIRSDYQWNWQKPLIIDLNHRARTVLNPFVIDK